MIYHEYMGYFGKLDLKLKAIELRENGFSVKIIQKKLQVSRSSVSLWIRGIELTQSQRNKLYLNQKTGALKGSIIAAQNKINKREEITKKLLNEGIREIGSLSRRDKFIAGLCLYFAEGNKADKSVSFTNSDPKVIKFMADWLRVFCRVPEEKFRCSIYLHDNLDEVKAKIFWSSLINVPSAQFTKSYLVKDNPNRLRKTKHIYGVFRITVNDVNLLRKIMGWIAGLFGGKILAKSPVAQR